MNDFSVHRIIGRGGFGEVYGCRKADTGKICHDCPFIVCMTYAFHTPDKLCFILDLMNGGDLHYHLSQHGVFSEKEMRFYATEIILGLEHMHNRFVVYRDLKWYPWVHGSRGAAEGDRVRQQRRLVLPRLHAIQTPERNVELPDAFSAELKSLLEGLLQRDVSKRLGCHGGRAQEVKEHSFFSGIDWQHVSLQKYPPPLIPPRGEVNAADAFDIGSFDEEDTKGIKLLDCDQELYKNFPLVISERWQQEVAETVYEAVNADTDKIEARKRAKNKQLGHEEDYALGRDCIMHGYMLKLGNPFLTQWQRRYFYLFPNRLEWRGEGESRQNLLTMEQILSVEETQIKDKKCILLRIKGGKQFVLQCESDPEFVQWKKELTETFTEAQRLLRRAPKFLNKSRSGVVELSKPPLCHRNSNGL
ncbi:hypothetical protein MC885_021761 [Smutsia gigantea]|nr:hypothetical protein MC885_021761 [Smutsia gigantea]